MGYGSFTQGHAPVLGYEPPLGAWVMGRLPRGETLDYVISPLQGHMNGNGPIHIGPRPYARVYCPYGA